MKLECQNRLANFSLIREARLRSCSHWRCRRWRRWPRIPSCSSSTPGCCWREATRHVESSTAVGNAGMLAFSIISFGMGVLWVVNTLVSQSFGRKAYHECGRFLWQGVWFSFAFAAVLWAMLPLLRKARSFDQMGHEGDAGGDVVKMSILKIVLGAVDRQVDRGGVLTIPAGGESAGDGAGFDAPRHRCERDGRVGDGLRQAWRRTDGCARDGVGAEHRRGRRDRAAW